MLHFRRRIALRMDIGNLLQFQRAFECRKRRLSISRFTTRMATLLSCLVSNAFNNSRCASGVSALAICPATAKGTVPVNAASFPAHAP